MVAKEEHSSQEKILEMSRLILVEGTIPAVSLLPAELQHTPKYPKYSIERHFSDSGVYIFGSNYYIPNLDLRIKPRRRSEYSCFTSGRKPANLMLSDVSAENMRVKEALKRILPDEVLIRLLPNGQICFESYMSSEGARFRVYDPHDGWMRHIEGLHDFYQGIKNGTALG